MFLQIGETPSEHSPNVAGEKLDSFHSTRIVNANLDVCRSLSDNDNIEIAEIVVRQIGHIRLVHRDLYHGIQRACATQRRGRTVCADIRAGRQKLGTPISWRELAMFEERDRLDAGQNQIFRDFRTEAAQAAQEHSSGAQSGRKMTYEMCVQNSTKNDEKI